MEHSMQAESALALSTYLTSLPALSQQAATPHAEAELQQPKEAGAEEKARAERELEDCYKDLFTFTAFSHEVGEVQHDMAAPLYPAKCYKAPWYDNSKSLKDNVTRRHGWHHRQGKKELAEEEEQCHLCQAAAFAIAQKPHRYLLHIVNWVDDEWISPEFRFLEKCVLGKGVKESLAPPGYRTGCVCETDLECGAKCMCLEDLAPNNIVNPKWKNAYYTDGPRKGLLRYEILELSNDEIYECSDLCTCSINCPNRVVGRGRKFSFEIFKTSNGRGWGVCSKDDIRKGQFIDKYVGEIITPQEANRRREQALHRKDLYLFAMDKFTNPGEDDQKLREPYEVDGEFMAGPTRFINHSCQPNLRVMAVVTDRANKHLHDLCFFALEDIPRGVEFTFDYVAGTSTAGDNATVAKEAKERRAQGEFTQECLCGAENCRGFLW